jgi:outer membrane beta-barrel protein
MKSLNLKSLSINIMLLSTMSLASPKLMGAEKDLYDFLWLDPDKKVYVLQNKVHKKEHTVYANLGVGLGLSSTFQDTTMLHGNAGFYLTEEWAVEMLYTSYSNKDNEALDNLKRLNGSIPFIRKTKSNYGAIARWSPFYGKINTFNKIFYFDWSFGLGLGKLNTESNAASVATPASANIYQNESYTSVIAKTELTLHATKNIHINLGLIMNNYKAPGPVINGQSKDKIRNNLDSILSVGFSF